MITMRLIPATTLVALLASAFVSRPALAQTTWHVDVNATAPGNGSPGSPYRSIQYAIDRATTVHGDTLLVAPGTYVETIDFRAKAIHVKSSAGALETVVRPPNFWDPLVVYVHGRNDQPTIATFEGFTVLRDGPRTGAGIRLASDASEWEHAVARRCVVQGHGRGIEMNCISYVYECTVTDCAIGVMDVFLGWLFMRNSIVWGNDVNVFFTIATPFNITYSNGSFSQGFPFSSSGSNIIQDPRFWNSANGDYRLRSDSPCIDTGDPTDPLDPDGSRIDMGAFTYDPFHAPGTATSCFGSNAACPCGNGGSGLGGCDIAQGMGGVAIGIRDFTPNETGGGTATIFGTNYPPASFPGATLIRSPAAQDPPVVFGDGLRCISAAGLVRVNARIAVGGAVELPVMHGAGAGTFYYQLWNRNTPITFCDPTAAFNLSNALEIAWP